MIVNINQIKPNPKNPRIIRDDKFNKLKKSLEDFPDMLNKRPLVVFTDKDKKYVVLGGNMRLKAAMEIGITELPIIVADEWTEEQKAQFLIKDNLSYGDWNLDELREEWDTLQLEDWGMDIPIITDTDINLDDFFESNDTEIISKYKLILEYTEEEYNSVINALKNYSSSKEATIYNLLGL